MNTPAPAEPASVADLIRFINETPALLIALGDVNLAPTQTQPNTRERCQMLLIAKTWKLVGPIHPSIPAKT